MKQDNSTYTVTAPDLLLTENGMTILISSTDEERVNAIKDIFERLVFSSLIFNVQKSPTNENTVAWLWYVSQPADIMIVDLDTSSTVDVCAALLRSQDEDHITVFYSEKHRRKDLIRLLNAPARYPIFSDIGDLEQYLKYELKVDDFE